MTNLWPFMSTSMSNAMVTIETIEIIGPIETTDQTLWGRRGAGALALCLIAAADLSHLLGHTCTHAHTHRQRQRQQ